MWWRARGRSRGVANCVGRKRRPTVELHSKREVDNFCCSHRRTSDVHFGQGRVGADNTYAFRYGYLSRLRRFLRAPLPQ
jgi:hypothetical protein